MTSPKKYTRRDFLKVFSGSMVNAAGDMAAAAIPGSIPTPARAAELRAANLAAAQSKPSDVPPDTVPIRCARCNSEFTGQANEPLCPTCREREEQ